MRHNLSGLVNHLSHNSVPCLLIQRQITVIGIKILQLYEPRIGYFLFHNICNITVIELVMATKITAYGQRHFWPGQVIYPDVTFKCPHATTRGIIIFPVMHQPSIPEIHIYWLHKRNCISDLFTAERLFSNHDHCNWHF